jgi:hypothetical protein
MFLKRSFKNADKLDADKLLKDMQERYKGSAINIVRVWASSYSRLERLPEFPKKIKQNSKTNRMGKNKWKSSKMKKPIKLAKPKKPTKLKKPAPRSTSKPTAGTRKKAKNK